MAIDDITAINGAVNNGKTMDAAEDWTDSHADWIKRRENIRANDQLTRGLSIGMACVDT